MQTWITPLGPEIDLMRLRMSDGPGWLEYVVPGYQEVPQELLGEVVELPGHAGRWLVESISWGSDDDTVIRFRGPR